MKESRRALQTIGHHYARSVKNGKKKRIRLQPAMQFVLGSSDALCNLLPMNERALVLDTGDCLAIRMADDALAEAGIPRFIVEFTRSGQSMEMPCAPSPGRGYRWQMAVPLARRREAQEVLGLLPIQISASLDRPQDLFASPNARRWVVLYRVLGATAIAGLAAAFYFLSR
jgi:hypothetical protein